MNDKPYQVGWAQVPSPDDPRYAGREQAIAAARRMCEGDAVIAVWRWDLEPDLATVVCLVYQDEVYRPA